MDPLFRILMPLSLADKKDRKRNVSFHLRLFKNQTDAWKYSPNEP